MYAQRAVWISKKTIFMGSVEKLLWSLLLVRLQQSSVAPPHVVVGLQGRWVGSDTLTIRALITTTGTHSLASMSWDKLSWVGSRCANRCTACGTMYSGSNNPITPPESTINLQHSISVSQQQQITHNIHICMQKLTYTARIDVLDQWCLRKLLEMGRMMRWDRQLDDHTFRLFSKHGVSPCSATLPECQTKQMPRT